MRRSLRSPLAALTLLLASSATGPKAVAQDVKEQSFEAPHGVTIKVRMEGPYTADTPSRSSATSNTPRTVRSG